MRRINRLTDILTALLAPQQNSCHLCGTLLGEGEITLCDDCSQALCRCRIHPLEAAARLGGHVYLTLSAFWHQDEARALVHKLKYSHDKAVALPLALGMCDAYGGHISRLPPIDGVAAVPTHPSRMRSRGYNQADVLARAFCGHTGLCYLPDALGREHHSASQVQRTREQRLSVMSGAFVACRDFSGMNVLLADDVLTTGATAMACAESLIKAGAASVTVITACRA